MKIADMAETRVLDIVEKCTDVSSETLVAQTADVLKEKNLQLHAARVQRNKDAGGSKKDAPRSRGGRTVQRRRAKKLIGELRTY